MNFAEFHEFCKFPPFSPILGKMEEMSPKTIDFPCAMEGFSPRAEMGGKVRKSAKSAKKSEKCGNERKVRKRAKSAKMSEKCEKERKVRKGGNFKNFDAKNVVNINTFSVLRNSLKFHHEN